MKTFLWDLLLALNVMQREKNKEVHLDFDIRKVVCTYFLEKEKRKDGYFNQNVTVSMCLEL